MRVGTGVFVGIPITLLQLATHSQTGVPVDGPTILNNFAVAHAVYDADRIPRSVGPLAKERFTTRAAALGAAAFYASTPQTMPLVPLVLALHTSYAAAKPAIAPVKPFFVGALWSLSVYGVPLLRYGPSDAPYNVILPAVILLSTASLSHAVDVLDLKEDHTEGVLTPAVRMGSTEATWYAAALSLSAAALHPPTVYDGIVCCASVGIASNRTKSAAVLSGLVLLRDVSAHGREYLRSLVETLITSSDGIHSASLQALVRMVRASECMPEHWRVVARDAMFAIMNAGDQGGSKLLHVYESLL